MSINLDLATRANLNALQTTQSLLSRSSKRLATGLRVSKPSDDSQAYFAAEALNYRAEQFGVARDNIQQASYALEASLSGLDGIRRLLDNVSGVLTNLSNVQNQTASDRLRVQYNQLLSQIDNLANSAAYQGVNLINNSVTALQVSFSGAYGQNDLTINAIRSDSAGLLLSTVAAGMFFQSMTTIPSQSSRDSTPSVATVASVASRAAIFASPALASQDSIASSASVASVATQSSTASTASNGSTPSQSSQPSVPSTASSASVESRAAVFASASRPSAPSTVSIASIATIPSLQSVAGVAVPGINLQLITAISSQVANAYSTLAATQSMIGIINDVLQVRTEFSRNFVAATLDQVGVLTAAELNQETANLKAMETAQDFGLIALTITTKAKSNLLRLF